MELELCAPCLFGLEGPLGNELRHMDMKDVRPENGRVYFRGDELALARANVASRFAERVLLVAGRFSAATFEELFQGVRGLPWEQYIPRNGAFPVTGWALESALHSVPDCQKIVKKAVAERLKAVYRLEWLPEDGETYRLRFAIFKNEAALYLDSSGTGLHKRGYRPAQVAAPLRETLAAAMVDIAGYRGKGTFRDPFCGSGTIAIEAALAAKNRAPGLERTFEAQKWRWLAEDVWRRSREEARSREYQGQYRILASDIDPRALELARANARRAGVEELIRFTLEDARTLSSAGEEGTVCCNPPYGERMLQQKEAGELYRAFGRVMEKQPGWSVYVISSHPDFERCYGRKAARRRRLYNGMIPCQLYMYPASPPGRK